MCDDDAAKAIIQVSAQPVLVDFWAAWCQPCRILAPHLEDLAKKYVDTLVVIKIDTEKHKRLAGELNVEGIPTLALYRDGELVHRHAGVLMGPQLEGFAMASARGPAGAD